MASKEVSNLESRAAKIFREKAQRSEEDVAAVELSQEWRDELVAPEGWNDVLDKFAVTMRLAVALTDPAGRTLGRYHNAQPAWRLAREAKPETNGGCPFCLAPATICTAASDALRTNSVVTVEDRAGFSHVAVPLILGGQKLGTLIAGQVFSRYPEPLPLQRIARAFGVSQQELWHLAIQQVPVARGTLQLYADLLLSLGQAFLGQRYAAILQKKLARTNERYRLFFDGVEDYALLTVDRAGRVTSWNHGAERLFGYKESEILGQDASFIVVPESVAGEVLQQPMPEADQSGWAEWEGWRIRKDGTRFLGACALASIGKAETREYGILIRDITERRRSEQDLLQAQKMEGIGVLAGGIAHDFNNLLTGIMGGVSVVKDSLSPDAPEYQMLEIAETSSARAAELVSQLLAYAGKGNFVISRFGFSALISEMLPLISASIPKAVELKLSLTPGLPWIEADASQIRQIVMNLIINGAEAIGPKGGTVQVSTGASDSGLDVFMEVKDSGSGMNEATQAKMFDPFFSTKFTGRGLGLAAVSGIVRRHKGKMHVDSIRGQGTTFRVSFPAVKAEVAVPVDAPQLSIASGAGTILVVDDEPELRRLAGLILERSGYSVLFAQNGQEAVEIFRQNTPGITAVLLDMTMPVMGGREAFGLIREIQPSVPIIVSSGYAEASTREELGCGAIAGFIQKPYTRAKLLECVQAAL
jgi:PAS domain S-box-containing protein